MPPIGPDDPGSAFPQGQEFRALLLDADGLISVAQLPIDDIRTLIGSSPSGRAYRHTQSVASTVWQISHGLGFDPAGLMVISDDGFTIEGAGVQYLIAGQTMRLSFDFGIAGIAYLS